MKPERDLYDFWSKNRETGKQNECRPVCLFPLSSFLFPLSPPSVIDWLPSSRNGPWRRTLVLYLQVPSHLIAFHRVAAVRYEKKICIHLPSTKHGGVEFDVIRESGKM